VTGQRPEDPERTRELRLPPVPGRPGPGPSRPVDPLGDSLVDQPTEQLPPPPPREHTGRFGTWQPLHPRVVPRPRRRSRTPYVVTALVLLVLAVGVVAVVLWG
jgi:hypothetical protein